MESLQRCLENGKETLQSKSTSCLKAISPSVGWDISSGGEENGILTRILSLSNMEGCRVLLGFQIQ